MPKARITREMVVEAAFAVARSRGIEWVNARTVAQALGCSTQPVMYQFATIGDMKRAVYEKADGYHTARLLDVGDAEGEEALLEIGLNYIRFAIAEPHLFRLLLQSGFAPVRSLPEMLRSQDLRPILAAMGEAMGLEEEKAREIFLTLALFVHGYASLLANNGLDYDEAAAASHLERVYRGALLAAEEEWK